jgi:hypothetical protein
VIPSGLMCFSLHGRVNFFGPDIGLSFFLVGPVLVPLKASLGSCRTCACTRLGRGRVLARSVDVNDPGRESGVAPWSGLRPYRRLVRVLCRMGAHWSVLGLYIGRVDSNGVRCTRSHRSWSRLVRAPACVLPCLTCCPLESPVPLSGSIPGVGPWSPIPVVSISIPGPRPVPVSSSPFSTLVVARSPPAPRPASVP